MKIQSIKLTNPIYEEILEYLGSNPPINLKEFYDTCDKANLYFPYYKDTKGHVSLTWSYSKDNMRIVKIKIQT